MRNYKSRQITDSLKRCLPQYVERITEPSIGKNMYVCPLCGSGNGKHSTGAFSIKNGVSFKCFSCNKSGDIFDLIGFHEELYEYNEQIERAKELFGDKISSAQDNIGAQLAKAEPTDYTDFFLQAHAELDKTSYPQVRGLSRKTLDRFNVGYVEKWKHPNAANNPNVPFTPRLIIPTGKYSYLARDTRADLTEQQKAYSKIKVGSVNIFNAEAIKNATQPIFIVEGEIDALSIIEVGGEAVALGSVTKADAFLDLIWEIWKKHKVEPTFIVALDADEQGERVGEYLADNLSARGFAAYSHDPYGIYKDANEALVNDRAALEDEVRNAAKINMSDGDKSNRERYLTKSLDNYIDSFTQSMTKSGRTPCTPTGFKQLDAALDGGLYNGLYILGAVSSLGKTTFVTQLADQIANSGRDVLFFSFEMSNYEIMSKSISRHTLQLAESRKDMKLAKTARELTTPERYIKFSKEEKGAVREAAEEYGRYAKHIFFEDYRERFMDNLSDYIRKHQRYTGKTPIVIIDYLQLIALYNERDTDKKSVDRIVAFLKKTAALLGTTIICISSFNRANYKESVSMEAFKESGAIEYSSDVLIGLQFKGTGEKKFDINEAKRNIPRNIELVILKNRNGRSGDVIPFNYYPGYNYFSEKI